MSGRRMLAFFLIGVACRQLQPEQPASLIATTLLIGAASFLAPEAHR